MIEAIIGIIGLILWVWGLIIAFQSSILFGIVSIFVPILAWIWVIAWIGFKRRLPAEIDVWWKTRDTK